MTDAHADRLAEGLTWHLAGDWSAAENAYRQILSAVPQHPSAWHYLGVLRHQQGRADEAIACLREAIAAAPSAAIYGHLGLAFKAAGRKDEALRAYRQALDLAPTEVGTLANLGNLLRERGELPEARHCLQQALTLDPEHVESHYNLALVCEAEGDILAAISAWQAVDERRPGLIDVYYHLGVCHRRLGQIQAAIGAWCEGLAIDPDHLPTLNDLGAVLTEYGKVDEAVQCFERILAQAPLHLAALSNLGVALKSQGRLHETLDVYDLVLAQYPGHLPALSNQAVALKDLGQHSAAISVYRRLLEHQPNFLDARSNYLFTLCLTPGVSPWTYLAEAQAYGQVVSQGVTPDVHALRPLPARLKVGFVSGDFKHHPVGYFIEGLLAHLDPARIEPYAYVTRDYRDPLTERIRPRFAAWRSLAGLTDAQAAEMIRRDGIDILIDLAGHTAYNRLPVFAWRPAPVQVSWLGYFASTGVPGMDYLLADPVSVPEAHRDHFTETVWYLPETRLCFTPPLPEEGLEVTSLPALEKGYVTFGSYQVLTKLNDAVLALWARVLKALPTARLRLQNTQFKSPAVEADFRGRLAAAGIEPARVTLLGAVRREAYLQSYGEVDLVLDTFPFTGGTTTCEALWMGVPTLTLAGDTLLARQGASLLTAAGLTDWITADADDYVTRAVAWANALPRLAQLRQNLRPLLLASPLADAARFSRHFQAALAGMAAARTSPNLTSPSTPPPPEAPSMPTFLHVGCGPKRKDRTTPGFNTSAWTELRLDIDETVNPDLLDELRAA